MIRLIALIVATTSLTGCGLGETAASAAAESASKAQELQQAKQTEARVRQQLDTAARQADEQRKAAEAAAQ